MPMDILELNDFLYHIVSIIIGLKYRDNHLLLSEYFFLFGIRDSRGNINIKPWNFADILVV